MMWLTRVTPKPQPQHDTTPAWEDTHRRTLTQMTDPIPHADELQVVASALVSSIFVGVFLSPLGALGPAQRVKFTGLRQHSLEDGTCGEQMASKGAFLLHENSY